MKTTRIAAILLLSFLFGGSGAEVAVQTKRAIDQRRSAGPSALHGEGSAGELVALQIQRSDGEILASPRFIATPGRVTELVLRDPAHPQRVHLALRVATHRERAGHLSVDYLLSMPGEELISRGRVRTQPGVERKLALGGGPLHATLITLPVPSAAFDAFLRHGRASRSLAKPS